MCVFFHTYTDTYTRIQTAYFLHDLCMDEEAFMCVCVFPYIYIHIYAYIHPRISCMNDEAFICVCVFPYIYKYIYIQTAYFLHDLCMDEEAFMRAFIKLPTFMLLDPENKIEPTVQYFMKEVCIHECMYMYTYIVHMYGYIYILYICIYIHTSIHVYIHTHTSMMVCMYRYRE
jgi:hypothetical protein